MLYEWQQTDMHWNLFSKQEFDELTPLQLQEGVLIKQIDIHLSKLLPCQFYMKCQSDTCVAQSLPNFTVRATFMTHDFLENDDYFFDRTKIKFFCAQCLHSIEWKCQIANPGITAEITSAARLLHLKRNEMKTIMNKYRARDRFVSQGRFLLLLYYNLMSLIKYARQTTMEWIEKKIWGRQ